MPKCSNCDGHVTPDFARVFGDRDDKVHACPECSTYAELQVGAGAQEVLEP